jgi:hypothetical protein
MRAFAPSQSTYNSWCNTLDNLGIVFEQFSASRYGHLDPSLPVLADGVLLSAHLAGKTVIVPNTPFDLGTPTSPIIRTPTTLLPGGAVRCQLSAAGVELTKGPARFLILSDATSGPCAASLTAAVQGSRLMVIVVCWMLAGPKPFSGVQHLVYPVHHATQKRIGGLDFDTADDFWDALKPNGRLSYPDYPGLAQVG